MRRATLLTALLPALLLLGACSSDPSDPPAPQKGSIHVRLLPAEVEVLAQWTFRDPDGQIDSYIGDQDLTDLDPGAYRITFFPVTGYFAADAVDVDLAAGDADTVAVTFVPLPPETGTVVIDVSPDLGQGWVLKVEADGGEYDVIGSGDRTVADLPPGRYTVDWQPYPDWTEPDGGQTDGVLVVGAEDQVSGTYVRRTAVELTMVPVPAGTFTMGSQDWELGFAPPFDTPIRPEDEAPRHQVTLTRDLLVSAYEITQGQYEAVHGTNPSDFGPGANLPVEKVNWLQAVQFCNELSSDEGLTLAYTISGPSVVWNQAADGYRLPTEAEWEYLARAGRDEAFNFGPITEPYFDDELDPVLDRVGWYLKNAALATWPVGSKLPNAWGVHDVHGNVWEWCWDRYDADVYTEDPETDPLGPTLGDERVVRGGSFSDPAANCRSATRFHFTPVTALNSVGFRVVRWKPAAEKALEK
ncbi:formylglycine-generating enzyme family protein [bacterium]|nr:formylglycine-generating enzyme family protein [bacterium]HPF35660.1 formylglycine-generating enzyme family protein [Candidatus Krumholzibacteria bacterium]HRX51344.1 formylglycine-generating enzyme family protein [Candidatus Krumholzibacteria bacterium]